MVFDLKHADGKHPRQKIDFLHKENILYDPHSVNNKKKVKGTIPITLEKLHFHCTAFISVIYILKKERKYKLIRKIATADKRNCLFTGEKRRRGGGIAVKRLKHTIPF